MNLSRKAQEAEAFLFAEGGSLSRKRLSTLLGCESGDLEAILGELRLAYEGRGMTLVATETEVTLAVSAEAQGALEKAFERELGKEIGDAGLEVLAIILYRGAASRAQVDYIRGVNSSSTVRALLSRGLIERAANPQDSREYLYRPTTELLAYLGVADVKDLPEYATICGELAAFEQSQKANEPFKDEHGTEFPATDQPNTP